MENLKKRNYWGLVGICGLSGAMMFLMSSCESIGGRYGPGAGFFDTVVVDAGHGGQDRGAKACCGSPEKSLTLDTARRLAGILRQDGFHVIETRTSDVSVSLAERTEISNSAGQAVFVSVHYNWAPRGRPHGIEIYYRSRHSLRLAANVRAEVTKVYRTCDRGLKSNCYYVLAHNGKPAILCELGFISSAVENKCIQSPVTRQKLAEAIAAGVVAERDGRIP